MITVVCIGLGLVPAGEKSEERVLVAAFAPVDSPIETTIEIVVPDATTYTVGSRYALALSPEAEDEGDG
jgi:hypothetical protein